MACSKIVGFDVKPGDRELLDAAVQQAGARHLARDVVEPQALAQPCSCAVGLTLVPPAGSARGSTNCSMALAKPSSARDVVTKVAARLTSSSALPIAMLMPLRWSIGMSLI